jgi:hypothetical protein
VIAFGLFAGACAPADVHGNYTVDLTDEMNGCSLSNWTAGSSTTNVPFVVTQSGGSVSGQVTGLAGVFVAAWLGSNTFQGSVTGSGVDMTLTGTNAMSQNGCAYTYNAHLVGTLQGNALMGTITYSAQTNGASGCGSLTGCQSVQDFSGSRPPP